MSNYVRKRGEEIPAFTREKISKRYHAITLAINQEFWNSTSDVNHSLYVGSYGRGTAISTSDIDILVELPEDEYIRFDRKKGNGQSRLLQAVKDALETTYPASKIHADGQVVVIEFSDGIVFEVLPAFKDILLNKYIYPDTNMGGRWEPTNPKKEQEIINAKDRECNGLLKDTCKHIRFIRNSYFSSYHLSGIVIDSFVYKALCDWYWICRSAALNSQSGEYERFLLRYCIENKYYVLCTPGSNQELDTNRDYEVLEKILRFMVE